MQPLHQDNLNCRYKDDLFFRVSDGENGSCDVFGHSHSTVSIYHFWCYCGNWLSHNLICLFRDAPPYQSSNFWHCWRGGGGPTLLKTKLQIHKIYIKIDACFQPFARFLKLIETVSGCSKTIWRRIAPKSALDFERGIGSEVKQTGPHPLLEILQGFPSHSVWHTHLRDSKRLLRHSISRAYGRPKTSDCAQF